MVPATPTGPLLRLIGGLDCKGKGTDHPLLEVGPVCLLDRGSIVGKDQPKFGMHPHYGVPVEGGRLGAWSGAHVDGVACQCLAGLSFRHEIFVFFPIKDSPR